MNTSFEYGTCRIKDLQVLTAKSKTGEVRVEQVLVDGRPTKPTKRFWTSLHLRFGFTHNIFRYFNHAEVFERISTVSPQDTIRWCIEHNDDGADQLLAVSNSKAAVIPHDDLTGMLNRYQAEDIKYANGIVTSRHAPRRGGNFAIGGDDFQNKFVLETPIDGFGKPTLYLSMLRLICTNGAVAHHKAFRSELNLGKSGAGVDYALSRVLDGFNNEEGYAALRQRFEASTRSWASVNEVNHLYRALVRLISRQGGNSTTPVIGTDGAAESVNRSQLLRSFYKMSGDLSQMYGLANPDALSVKRQRTLPSACKVYDVLNFASEVATHHATPEGNRSMQAFIGDVIGNEFDLENTADQFTDWRDFFIGSEAAADTLASMHRR